MKDTPRIKNALISVSNKEDLESLCSALHRHGVKIYSTQGTGEFLQKNFQVKSNSIESITQFPEMMDGRVKTLHPKIFGGILARREVDRDQEEALKFGIPLFDLVVVNLYPFADHRGETQSEQVPFIDIGGPSLIRAAAKNYRWVAVLSDPIDYPNLIEELDKQGGATRLEFRQALAAKVFARTSQYDSMIAAEWLDKESLPTTLFLSPQMPLRYGENPHQKAAWCGFSDWKILQGKELSYNNLLDAEAAVHVACEFTAPCVAIVKHNNPCGVAIAQTSKQKLSEVFGRALAGDPKSAFGGIVSFNVNVDGDTARALSSIFLEVVIARQFSSEALEIFSKKKNLRVIVWPNPTAPAWEIRPSLGGWLVQNADSKEIPADWQAVTEMPVTESVKKDLEFAWLVVKHVRSNAIVIAKDGSTLGIGAGQMSRVDSVAIALQKFREHPAAQAVLASDAFFPFRDNIDLLKGSGIVAIIQPGGSQRDAEVIDACNELGIAMVFTGQRHFRH